MPSEQSLMFKNKSNEHFTVKGKSVEDLSEIIPHLDGEKTIDLIMFEVQQPKQYVMDIVKFLISKNLITLDNLEEVITMTEDNVLSNKRIALIDEKNILNVDSDYIRTINVSSLDETWHIVIFVSFDEDFKVIEQLSELCTKNGVVFFPIIVNSTIMKFGPFFLPEGEFCYQCYISRILTNANHKDFLMAKTSRNSLDKSGLVEIASGIIKNQVVNFLKKNEYVQLIDSQLVYESNNLVPTLYKIYKVPYCEGCS